MSDFIIHTIESAPEESRPILEKFRGMLGFVPNLFGVMAEAPAMPTARRGRSSGFATTCRDRGAV